MYLQINSPRRAKTPVPLTRDTLFTQLELASFARVYFDARLIVNPARARARPNYTGLCVCGQTRYRSFLPNGALTRFRDNGYGGETRLSQSASERIRRIYNRGAETERRDDVSRYTDSRT